jgi:hypothetical protein
MRVSTSSRPSIAVMSVGLALTVIGTVVPFLGGPTGSLVAQHLKAGYPEYGRSRIDAAVLVYLVALAILGGLGVITWVVSMILARTSPRAARWVSTTALVVGTALALFDASIRDTSGDTGLPLSVGLLGLLPSVAGLAAVVLIWRRARGARAAR